MLGGGGEQRFEQEPELELAELQERPPRPRAQLESKPDRNSEWRPAMDIGEGAIFPFAPSTWGKA